MRSARSLQASLTVEDLTMERSPSNRFLHVTTRGPSATAMYTSPTGFSGVAPPGPAIPVTAIAVSEP